ncbi:hypothetical protein GEMRC1_001702 [Eukaryota sp. GEM-RC1]
MSIPIPSTCKQAFPRLFYNNLSNVEDVLSRNSVELVFLLETNLSSIKKLKKECASALLSRSSFVASSLPTFNHFSFGCNFLNSYVNNVFYPGSLFEICGKAGSGKTQLCYQLLVSNLHPSDSHSIYIKTEGDFSADRINHLATSKGVANDIDRILLQECGSLEDLEQSVYESIPLFLETGSISVLIIDSIAGVCRGSTITNRSTRLSQLTLALKRLSFRHLIPIFIVNQVTDVTVGSDSVTIPFMGMSWSYQINHRLMIHRDHEVVLHRNLTGSASSNARKAILDSNGLSLEFNLHVGDTGVTGTLQ